MASTTTPAPSSSTRPDILPNEAVASGSSQRQRGPVEEVIAKRMRQLGKKLQRYRAYAAADEKTLNADQRAAINSLPALEGAYKELEDLVREKGPIEEQELIQAAKLREAKDAARADALAESGSGVENYKTSLISPLSSFLRLYALLHPARPNDHEHLTFSALDLPSHLQDEVQATDILRVGRMHDDLTSGGEAAKAVLDTLVGGRAGDDEETDRVHHLLHLISQPAPATETDATSANETSAEDPYIASALVGSAEEAVEAVPESVVSEQPFDLSNGHSTHTGSAPINFLQDDELEVQEAPVTESQVDLQPPAAEVNETQTPTEPPVTQPSKQPARSFAPIPTGNWADLDDEDIDPVVTEQSEPAATQEAQTDVPEPTSADQPAEQPTEIQTPGESAEPSPTASTSSTRGGKGARGRKPTQRPNRGRNAPAGTSQGQSRNARQPRDAQTQSGQPGQKMVDDDGFEMKVRRGPQNQSRQPSTGGRGGQGGQRGGTSGTQRGRGGGRGGRGGMSGATQANGQARKQAGQGTQSGEAASKPKASIYKEVQPSGPKSAPIS